MAIEFGPLRPLLELLEQYGISKNQYFAALNTKDTHDPQNLRGPHHTLEGFDTTQRAINTGHIQNWLDTAVTLSGDSSLALRLGRNLDFSSLGVLGFAIQNCSNLGNALKLALHYHTLFNLGALWKLFHQGNEVTLQLTLRGGKPHQLQMMTEMVFAQFFALIDSLSGKPVYKAEVHLNYPKPDYFRRYKKFLPVKIKFDQPQSQIIFSEEILKLPIRSANPARQVVFQQQCEELLLDLNRVENTSSLVRRLLIQSAGEFPNLVQVAKKLHMSESTLRRRLDSEATSFRMLCDEVKNVLAKKYLRETELTVADIAHLLDYTDTANFRRAFVRWNKVPPNYFRHSL